MENEFYIQIRNDFVNKKEVIIKASDKYKIIQDFFEFYNIKEKKDIYKARKEGQVGNKLLGLNVLFGRFIASKSGIGHYAESNDLHKKMGLTMHTINPVINGEIDNKLRGHFRRERTIRVIDAEGKELSYTTAQKSVYAIKKGRAVMINEETIQLNHVVAPEDVQGYESVFQRALRIQGGCHCNKCGIDLDEVDADIHHVYIPRCLKIINSGWNIELLCKKCHREKHQKGFIRHIINITLWLKERYPKLFNN